MTSIWITIALALVFGALVAFATLRLSTHRGDQTVTMGLFMLAALLAIIAIASVTFFRKAVAG